MRLARDQCRFRATFKYERPGTYCQARARLGFHRHTLYTFHRTRMEDANRLPGVVSTGPDRTYRWDRVVVARAASARSYPKGYASREERTRAVDRAVG